MRWGTDISKGSFGSLFNIDGNDTIKLEHLEIQWKDVEMFFVITSPDSSSTTSLKLTSSEGLRFTFVNTDTGFPAKVIYELINTDTLRTVREGKINDKKQVIEQLFVRSRLLNQAARQPVIDSTEMVSETGGCDPTCFEWMSGRWYFVDNGDTLIEEWRTGLSDDGGSTLWRVTGSDSLELEERMLQWESPIMFLTITPKDSNKVITLKLVRVKEAEYTFVNIDTGFPRKIIYEYLQGSKMRKIVIDSVDGKEYTEERVYIYSTLWRKMK